jgi:hypothetical protein
VSLAYSSRFYPLAKNALGIRGPFPVDVPNEIGLGFELGQPLPEFDDFTLYWSLTSSIAAVAAQFSFVAFNVPSGRAIIDAVLFRPPAAAQVYRAAYASPFGGTGAVVIRNNYGAPPPANHFTSVVRSLVSTQVADPIPSGTNPAVWLFEVPTSTPFMLQGDETSTLIFPGQDFVIATGAVNQTLGINVFGRAWPTFPE